MTAGYAAQRSMMIDVAWIRSEHTVHALSFEKIPVWAIEALEITYIHCFLDLLLLFTSAIKS